VYGLRTYQKYLGYKQVLDLKMQGSLPLLLALLPYKVSSIDLDVPQSVKVGQQLNIAGRISTNTAQTADAHIVKIRLRQPSGKIMRAFTKTVFTEKGRFQHTIPLAFNEEKGKWHLQVTDIISGKIKKQSFIVK
jgi:hypothetical protein